MVYAVDMVYTVDTVDTVDTIQTALHCLNSSWAGGTDVAEIANIGYVVDWVEEAYWADGAEMALHMNALFDFDRLGHKELKRCSIWWAFGALCRIGRMGRIWMGWMDFLYSLDCCYDY